MEYDVHKRQEIAILRELNKTGIDEVKLTSMPRNCGVLILKTCGQQIQNGNPL
jgi:hypothetical protein